MEENMANTGYESITPELQSANERLEELLEQAASMPGISDPIFEQWETACRRISEQLSDDRIRVAVVGAIKSGKSTLINALLGGDFLKRGAGVVTSMVTRLGRGEKLSASLYFKSWAEVNDDIQRALALFPSPEWRSRKDAFDIRRESDRRELDAALESLSIPELVSNDTRNLNSLYLSGYLQGYDRVQDLIGEENVVREFSGQQFSAHQEFSGNDTLAFYLKDIALTVDSESIPPSLEIADCQGSDSPNPLHLAMIQDYLLSANLLVYVISSRTGIRQADINFLSMIRRMGFIEHLMFVVNFDFGEHDAPEDLDRLVSRIREDLRIIRTNPRVYTFSALYSLFRSMAEDLSRKDRQRLAQWEADSGLAGFSGSEEARFRRDLNDTVTRQRYLLLYKAPIDRLRMIAKGLRKWCRMNREVLHKGADEFDQLLQRIKSEQKRIDRVQSMVRSTVEGALQQIKREIKKEVDGFLDPRYGEAAGPILDFVRNYTIPTERYSQELSAGRFSDALYLAFQEFTHAVDSFMAETVNPKIYHFIKTEEDRIRDYFDSVTGPYEAMVNDAMAHYNSVLKSLGFEMAQEGHSRIELPDLQALKRQQELELPPAAATLNYSRAIKTEAIMRFGMYNLASRIRRLFRRSGRGEAAEAHAALRSAVRRMKRETEDTISFQFKNYKENLKFQYLFSLVDAVAQRLQAELTDRLHDFTSDLVRLREMTGRQQVDENRVAEQLQFMDAEASDLEGRLRRMAEEIAAREAAADEAASSGAGARAGLGG